MRKVTHEVVTAFKNHEKKRVGNTRTDGEYLFLHGHVIAYHLDEKTVQVSMAGHPTATTKERINGLFQLFDIDASVFHDQGRLFLRVGDYVAPMDHEKPYTFVHE